MIVRVVYCDSGREYVASVDQVKLYRNGFEGGLLSLDVRGPDLDYTDDDGESQRTGVVELTPGEIRLIAEVAFKHGLFELPGKRELVSTQRALRTARRALRAALRALKVDLPAALEDGPTSKRR